jgi:hypothetical protein
MKKIFAFILFLGTLSYAFAQDAPVIKFEVTHHDFGTVKEEGEGGPANHAGPATSTSDVHWSKKQPKVGPKGKLKKYGQPMIFKAIVRRKATNESTVYYKAYGD